MARANSTRLDVGDRRHGKCLGLLAGSFRVCSARATPVTASTSPAGRSAELLQSARVAQRHELSQAEQAAQELKPSALAAGGSTQLGAS